MAIKTYPEKRYYTSIKDLSDEMKKKYLLDVMKAKHLSDVIDTMAVGITIFVMKTMTARRIPTLDITNDNLNALKNLNNCSIKVFYTKNNVIAQISLRIFDSPEGGRYENYKKFLNAYAEKNFEWLSQQNATLADIVDKIPKNSSATEEKCDKNLYKRAAKIAMKKIKKNQNFTGFTYEIKSGGQVKGHLVCTIHRDCAKSCLSWLTISSNFFSMVHIL